MSQRLYVSIYYKVQLASIIAQVSIHVLSQSRSNIRKPFRKIRMSQRYSGASIVVLGGSPMEIIERVTLAS